MFRAADEFYKYDSAKTLKVDVQRQEIIHRVRWESPSSTIVVDIAYLDNTCQYLIWLLARKYRIQTDLAYWFQLSASKQPTKGGAS